MYSSETLRTRSWKRQTSERANFNDIHYEPVATQEQFDARGDEVLIDQFLRPSVKIPWSGVLFAATLCIGGAVLLSMAILLLTGYIDPKYVDRTWPMIVLGLIMFIPGVYHLRIALYAFLSRPGYSFEDIPDFD